MTGKVVRLRQPPPAEPLLSNEAVAAACSTGDPAAVAELFDRYHQSVTRFLSRSVGQAADVEDLLQATFMEVARGRTRFDGRSAVLTWLLGVAANVARHHIRTKARQSRLRAAFSVATSAQTQAAPDQAVEARRALLRVQRALEALPVERRLAFVLCEIEGLSAREAATVLGTSESAVWKRVSDARKALRRATGKEVV